jgi:hypothetical protein
MPIVKLRISPNGDTEVETQGVKGAACKQLTKSLEDRLGTHLSSELTSEYFQDAEEVHLDVEEEE